MLVKPRIKEMMILQIKSRQSSILTGDHILTALFPARAHYGQSNPANVQCSYIIIISTEEKLGIKCRITIMQC